ncbi:SseB family protein [Streptomyces sp. TX20-6-3]|uniref:SseB family protein n=1 Tax=Streptomyces sp. TX20-6-3 TaxID=3028705 RepID=UPI0029A7AE1E|nr:SseB family protein [Streptomyces sp. TX20-6-3]MDX2562518.1 SseB family protein [Streptomyces sp. TX20-6-3]
MNQDGDETPQPQQVWRLAELAETPVSATPPKPEPEPTPQPPAAPTTPHPTSADELARAQREFARLLGEFRRTAVLVPFDDQDSLWTADFNGVRWICAFSDEEALGRFAAARGEAGREWTYRTILGARLLDAMVPMLPGPGGVALDAGSADGMVFPPVAGIVPDEAAVDLEDTVDLGGTGTR